MYFTEINHLPPPLGRQPFEYRSAHVIPTPGNKPTSNHDYTCPFNI